MNPLDRSTLRMFLVETTQVAGNSALEAQKNPKVLHDFGGGAGITTQTDVDAQKIITDRIQAEYPTIPIVGEEGNELKECPSECFIVDPIDGTASYNAGAPDWSTTLAYRNSDFMEGVIYIPCLEKMYRTGSDEVQVHIGHGKTSTVFPLQTHGPKKPQWRICFPMSREFF